MKKILFVSLFIGGCDDTIFGSGVAATTDYPAGYDGVTEIFADNCVSCHGGSNPVDGLDLETDPCAAIVDVANDEGDFLVASGDSAASVLWNKMANTGNNGGVMPPSGALDSTVVDIVTAWIDDGAVCEDSGTP